jgi:hypothetical protein
MVGKQVWFLWLLSFLLFAEALSWWTAGGLGPCLIQPEHNQQTANDDKEQDCPTFFAGSLLLSQRGVEWIKSNDNDKAVVAGFTIVLAISTIGLWFATIDLYKAGERQIEFLRESSEAQGRDMQASVSAAQRSADAAMLSIGADRAWITFDEIFIDEATNGQIDGVPFERAIMVQVRWKNTGRTPAIKSNTFITHSIIGFDDNVAAFQSIPPENGHGIIGIGTTVLTAMRVFPDEQRRSIFDRQTAIAIYSAAYYHDLFSGTERTSEVCWRIRFNGWNTPYGGGASIARWDVRIIGPHNRIT